MIHNIRRFERKPRPPPLRGDTHLSPDLITDIDLSADIIR